MKKVFLGEVNYLGEMAKAFREVYPNCWKFVIVTKSGRRQELITY